MINKMKEVAEMLGLDIDEEFDIMIRENDPSNYNPFKIREQGLVDKDCVLANDYLNELPEPYEKKRPTYSEDFLKKFPHAQVANGRPVACRDDIYPIESELCFDCDKCWNEKMEVNE